MIIQHNMGSLMANRQLNINRNQLVKSSEKLSSGYKINRAADNAAGLVISEKMRSQIRGLERGTQNAEDGVSFINVADGAMGEMSDMLIRLKELTVQALNDTNTLEDKATIEREVEELQSEIDSICKQTEFNTRNVFESHEDTYYSIEGSKKWYSDQIQIIEEPKNDLIIYLPEEYMPSTYEITVPNGIYTTQELVDEIDTALEEMVPSNPGFVLEFTNTGYCNLNFEGGKSIQSVEGALSGLIYGRYDGSEYGKLVGTTQFEAGWPLKIVYGQNDTLTFYAEDINGTDNKKLTLTIDPGDYTREALIDKINESLTAQSIDGVVAKEFGEKSIQLTAGKNLITGLKGNMFAIDEGKKYTSIFYDNVKNGYSTQTSANIHGQACYLESSVTDKIKIDSNNNTLSFKVDDGEYQNIVIESGEYTVKELVQKLNDQIDMSKVEASCITTSRIFPGTSYYKSYDSILFTSKSVGENSKLEFDKSTELYGNTYESLFCDTNVSFVENAALHPGVSVEPYLRGQKYLTGSIALLSDEKTLGLLVNGTNYTLNLSQSNYNSIDELISDINDQINNAGIGIQNKIIAQNQGGYIRFTAADASIVSIVFNPVNKGSAYSELFSRDVENTNYTVRTDSGTEVWNEGSTKPDSMAPATINLGHKLSNSINIDGSNNMFNIRVNNVWKYITLSNGTYSQNQLLSEMNNKFSNGNIGINASLETNGSITFTTKEVGNQASLYVHSNSSGSAMKVLVGTYIDTIDAVAVGRWDGGSYIQGVNQTFPLTIDEMNKELIFNYEENSVLQEVKIELAEGSYSYDDLKIALKTGIDSIIGNGKINIDVDSNGVYLGTQNEGSQYQLKGFSGGFYDNVLCKMEKTTSTINPTLIQGTHTFKEAFIVGRQDLLNSTKEIIENINDQFIIDFTYPDSLDPSKTKEMILDAIIPPGEYSGEDLALYLEEKLNKQLVDNGIDKVRIEAAIGGINTGVVGATDDNVLNFSLKEMEGKEADKGNYILDGVRGSSAYTIFYKTVGKLEPAYIEGSKNIEEGVEFTIETNVFTFTTDGIDYSYTFNPGVYTADEFLDLFNQKFTDGDDNGNIAPLRGTLLDGKLKIQHKLFGEKKIENIDGSGKGIIFYQETGREDLEDLLLNVKGNTGEPFRLERLNLNTSAMKINSITVSKNKYANKALRRIDSAINYLSEKRSLYGAKQNGLFHIIFNNENITENTQAAESRIRDVDMADEMVKYSKQNILQQIAQSVLAQANMSQEAVVKLLE